MKLKPCMVRILTCAPLIVSLLSTATAAESSPGAIVGIITDAARVPVVHVTVTALRADGRAIRAENERVVISPDRSARGEYRLHAFASLTQTPDYCPIQTLSNVASISAYVL
jgi:hypothetical protein